jgi:hypothetical protein
MTASYRDRLHGARRVVHGLSIAMTATVLRRHRTTYHEDRGQPARTLLQRMLVRIAHSLVRILDIMSNTSVFQDIS